ncbi:MAG: STAS domain-containing protein [Ignavibacteriaceae bacterium]|jgi:anti-anti-sigma factor
MEDFKKFVIDNIVVEIVNITRATYKEAAEMKKILREDIKMGFKKIVIDLSMCEFLDSTFIGVLVVILKEVAEVGGELRLVKPPSLAHTILAGTRTLELFNILDTTDQAINSIQYMDTIHDRLDKIDSAA